MRQIRFVLLMCATFLMPSVFTAKAQSAGPRGFGILVGVSRSTISGDDVLSATQERTGIVAGVTFAMPIRSRLGLEIDALYAQRGYRLPIVTTSSTATYRVNSSYLDLPVLLTVSTGGKRIVPYLVGGGSLNLQVGCTVSITGGAGRTESCEDAATASGEKVNSLDAAIIGGAGVRVLGSKLDVSFDARYQYGTMQIVDGFDGKNRSMTFALGLRRASRKN